MSFIQHIRKYVAFFIFFVAASCAVSMAHEVKVGPNGGPVSDLGDFHLELVMKPEMIRLFVTDAAGNPVNVAKGSANLIILAGNNKYSTKLIPAGESVLGGAFVVPDPAPYTVVSVVILEGKKPLQARFVVN